MEGTWSINRGQRHNVRAQRRDVPEGRGVPTSRR